MLTIDELTIKWDSLKEQHGPVYQGYDATHPLKFFLGLDLTGKREFFIIVTKKPASVPDSSRSIEVFSGSRRDGTHTLVFRLVQPEQQEVFTHLCWDLAEASRQCINEEKGMAIVVARFKLWQRLMEKGSMGLLSEKELKGLFGEIYFLKNWLFQNYGAFTATTGWVGPTGSDRDFVYDDYWYEVKTINPGAPSLKISSIEQLDIDSEGRIALVEAEKTASTDPSAVSLPILIKETKKILEVYPEAQEVFSMRVLESGFIDRKEYCDLFFACRNLRLFSVSEGFPRIRRRDIDTGILDASYEISITQIQRFEILLGEQDGN